MQGTLAPPGLDGGSARKARRRPLPSARLRFSIGWADE